MRISDYLLSKVTSNEIEEIINVKTGDSRDLLARYFKEQEQNL